MSPVPALLEMRGIDKRFGAVHANRGVDLDLGAGEILGLLGENGAGKTTLMNVLFGIYRADAGVIRIAGSPARVRRPADAIALGVGMVHQHFHLVARHSVLENLMVGARGRGGLLDRAGARARLARIGTHYGLELDPERRVEELSVGEQQRLEICKALFRGARILILDEPTSVLTPQQGEGLFRALRALAADRVGVIFISHKLPEVLAITDRVVVMRRGAVVAGTANDGALDRHRLAELMCGHEIHPPQRRARVPGRTLLRLREVAVRGPDGRETLAGVSLELRAGEILGIAGVSGNGQGELAEVVAGVRRAARGTLEVDGQPANRAGVRGMQRLGIAHVPEDRIGAGLIGALPLAESMALARIWRHPFSRAGWLRRAAIRAFAARQIERFAIDAPGPGVRTASLSGGNLQKALLARELAFEPRVLVAAQPTRGLDVAAVDFVHRQFLGLRERGAAVLLISEDLEELIALADRIAVLYEGRIAGELGAEDASPARLGLLMAGEAA